MKQSQYLVAVLLALGLTVASGIVSGTMSNRWGPSQDSLAAARKLESFPEEFGSWKLQSTETMSENVVKVLECSGYISRVYVSQESGEKVSVAVLLGPSGPISVHTPEVCFSSRDHKTLESRKLTEVKDSHDQFWAMTFESNNVSANLIRVYYAWTPGDHWAATEDPRVSFASCPYLYKIQLASHHPAGTDLTTDDPCKHFLEDFTPAIREYLVNFSDSQ